jgi:hypothetical protein
VGMNLAFLGLGPLGLVVDAGSILGACYEPVVELLAGFAVRHDAPEPIGGPPYEV